MACPQRLSPEDFAFRVHRALQIEALDRGIMPAERQASEALAARAHLLAAGARLAPDFSPETDPCR